MTEGQAMNTAISAALSPRNPPVLFDLEQPVSLSHPYTAPYMGVPDYASEMAASTALLMALEYLQDAQGGGEADYRVLAALEYIEALTATAGLNPDALKPKPKAAGEGKVFPPCCVATVPPASLALSDEEAAALAKLTVLAGSTKAVGLMLFGKSEAPPAEAALDSARSNGGLNHGE